MLSNIGWGHESESGLMVEKFTDWFVEHNMTGLSRDEMPRFHATIASTRATSVLAVKLINAKGQGLRGSFA